ncbi:hypothetical protein M501DRAFT_721722 [Patellaria atrata CBS 101060]|uniref:Uncharacterized protein n=1 Tax=Patellaria atrata CBS 101060 TaxID=1346257 RepID=A0A9P4SDG5_9PEZI|nr:hypothetical protein M501DRAFT_721722 [Patellaria atrata CBS 101060]
MSPASTISQRSSGNYILIAIPQDLLFTSSAHGLHLDAAITPQPSIYRPSTSHTTKQKIRLTIIDNVIRSAGGNSCDDFQVDRFVPNIYAKFQLIFPTLSPRYCIKQSLLERKTKIP